MQKYHIQLFADGAATAGADGVGTTVDTNVDGATGTQDAKEESFDDLIKGRYKQDYQAKFDKALNKRMSKANAQIQEGIDFRNKLTPALEKFAAKYGIKDSTDIDSIVSAIDSDNSIYEEIATERGVTVEQAKELMQAERIIRQDEIRQQQDAQKIAFQNQMNAWWQEAEELKEYYPNFNFELESKNDKFREWLNRGMSVKDAYEHIHLPEFLSGAMGYAYNQCRQDIADTMRANANRPIENGTSQQQASNYSGMSFDKLNQNQIKELLNAASLGEKIDEKNFMKYLSK
jgi:hypothetical protein|nr:MAG TPA: hypothetical protein [Caudoviricetes sp.]